MTAETAEGVRSFIQPSMAWSEAFLYVAITWVVVWGIVAVVRALKD